MIARVFASLLLALLPATLGAAETSESTIIEDVMARHILLVDRTKKVLAHVVTDVSPGTAPQVVIAFPQGNSGAILTFRASKPARVTAESAQAWQEGDQRGIVVDLASDAKELTLDTSGSLDGFWLDSLRQVRDIISKVPDRGTYLDFADAAGAFAGLSLPDGQVSAELASSNELRLSRTNVVGKIYQAVLTIPDGSIEPAGAPRRWRIASPSGLRMSLLVSNDYPPLDPLPEKDIWKPGFEAQGRDALAAKFLGTTDKFMAGSYRFLTYFGRDTLIAFCNLQDLLQRKAQEVMIGSVLDRLSDAGRVAHEEELGDRPIFSRMQQYLQFVRNYQIREAKALIAGIKSWDEPNYNYDMIDGDFLLPSAALRLIRDRDTPQDVSIAFWLRRNKRNEANVRSLLRNWNLVLTRAQAGYVRCPGDILTCNWRDSNDGLAGGVYPGDVNGILIPAALHAIQESRGILLALLGPAEIAKQAEGFPEVQRLIANEAAIAPLIAQWDEKRKLFWLTGDSRDLLSEAVARAQARDPGLLRREVLPGKTLEYLNRHPQDLPNLRYLALSADSKLHPIGIMNTDEVFSLQLEDLSDADFARDLLPIFLPYPLGQWTDDGPLVANPAHGADAVWTQRFGSHAYHGEVVWGWVNKALKSALLRRAQSDIDQPERAGLFLDLYRLAQEADDRSGSLSSSELWCVEPAHGKWNATSFFDKLDKETIPNPIQLWSITGRLDVLAGRIAARLGKRPRATQARLVERLIALAQSKR